MRFWHEADKLDYPWLFNKLAKQGFSFMRWPAHFALSGDSEPSGIYYIQGKGAGFIIKRLIIKVLIN